jgi:hypothetical protein
MLPYLKHNIFEVIWLDVGGFINYKP